MAEGRTTAGNKRASIAGDIFDRGMRAATLAQAAMPLFLICAVQYSCNNNFSKIKIKIKY